MAGAQFEYDEKGTTFYYFVLCFCAIVLLPITYFSWALNFDGEKKNDESKVCHCDKCSEKRLKKSKQKPKTTFLRIASHIVIVILWIALLYGVYRVSQFEKDFIEYDPFAVLEIDKGASAAEIKRQYRKLSLVYHPDKESGDERKFMRIAKAYEAFFFSWFVPEIFQFVCLTNEESRKNWEEHGNPDGPQATTFGIALPSWIVSEENSLLVLGVYIFAFMIVLPSVVGTWWYRSIKYGNDQVLMDTSRIYLHFFAKTSCMPLKRVTMIFSSSMEFEKKCNQEVQERPSDNVELPKLLHELKTVNENVKENPFGYPYSVKCRALILSHIDRLALPQETLQKDLELILKKSPLLIQEMINCISQLFYYYKSDQFPKGPHLDTLENVMKFSQQIIQAASYTKSSLMQLPHILPEHLRHFASKKAEERGRDMDSRLAVLPGQGLGDCVPCAGSRLKNPLSFYCFDNSQFRQLGRNVRGMSELLKMKRSERRDMLRFLNEQEYEDVILVAQMFPHIEVDVKPHVMDDEDEGVITAGAVVTVDVQLTRKTLKDVCCDGIEDEEEDHEENRELSPENENAEETKVVSKTKIWQKTKRKAKKAKPVKQQAKKKPVKQQAKKDDSQTKEEESKVEGKKEEGKKHKNELRKRSPGKQEKRKKSVDLDDDNDDIDPDNNDDDSDIGDHSDDSRSASGGSDSESQVDFDDDDEWQRMQKGVDKMEKVLDTKSKTSHDVHAPFFPEDKQEWWWVYICDRKKQEIITVPTQVVNLQDTETVKLQFQAPVKCGHYSYTAVVRSDSYMEVDVSKLFKINVHEAKEFETKQWDFESDEDEDKDNESGESEWDEEEESD